ncbi:hypothetical protein BpHYR1_001436 [Brachionus plicatilis]|uniref:Uncharacterized protein n=1 Tax=Brachionus plicatilis TaxID=10195 RepID=A0A3M7PUW6_BRAPC|nr:hypothetical protein BpHYR1_001436 [Brachionus plicatilis]
MQNKAKIGHYITNQKSKFIKKKTKFFTLAKRTFSMLFQHLIHFEIQTQKMNQIYVMSNNVSFH